MQTSPDTQIESLRNKEYKLLGLEFFLLFLVLSAEQLISDDLRTQLESLDNLSANEAKLITYLAFILPLLIIELAFRFKGSQLTQQRIDLEMQPKIEDQNRKIGELKSENTNLASRLDSLEAKLSTNSLQS